MASLPYNDQGFIFESECAAEMAPEAKQQSEAGSASTHTCAQNCVNNNAKEAEVWQETRMIVDAFLKRSISHNAKTSTNCMKPEGYHKLKSNGRLPYYQRQQSRPERGSFSHRKPELVNIESAPHQAQLSSARGAERRTSRPAFVQQASVLEERSSSAEVDFKLGDASDDEDGRHHEEDIPAASMMLKLMDASSNGPIDTNFYSSDSLPSVSDGDDGLGSMRRRKSFVRAVNRKSVLSYIERAQREAAEQNSSKTPEPAGNDVIDERKSSTLPAGPAQSTNSPRMARRSSLKTMTSSKPQHAQQATSRSHELLSTTHDCSAAPSTDDVDARSSLEKKPGSFRERMKRVMSGPSNKRRMKYWQRVSSKGLDDPSGENLSASSSSYTRQSSREDGGSVRSPSPNKSAHTVTPKIAHRSSPRKPPSPKLQAKLSPRPVAFPTSSSSANVSNYDPSTAQGALARGKSDSLPPSARFGVGQPPARIVEPSHVKKSKNGRRFSEDVSASAAAAKTTAAAATASSTKHHHHHHHRHANGRKRPQHLDLTDSDAPPRGSGGKNQKHGGGGVKWRKKLSGLKHLLRGGRGRSRHNSESSTSSVSLPSIPNALEHDENLDQFDERGIDRSSTHHPHQPVRKSLSSRENLPTRRGGASKPYHHRGSLSFSSGDLDRVSYDEIAETLERISVSFNRQLLRRSSTPGSKISTPDTSSTSQQIREGIVTSQPSRTMTTTYRNVMTSQQTSVRKSETLPSQRFNVNMPKSSIPRRHTHHVPTGSLDSPHAGPVPRRLLPHPPPPGSGEKKVGGDVSDDDDVTTSPMTCSECGGGLSADAGGTSLLDLVGDMRMRTATTQHDGGRGGDEASSSSGGRGHVVNHNMDEDKLVELLVQALIMKGDEFERSIDLPNGFEPLIRRNVVTFLGQSSYERFRNVATRFSENVSQLVVDSPHRHPDVFPVVMVLEMASLLVNIVRSESTRQYIDHIVDFSTDYVTQVVRGAWQTFLGHAQETQEELDREETSPVMTSSQATTSSAVDHSTTQRPMTSSQQHDVTEIDSNHHHHHYPYDELD